MPPAKSTPKSTKTPTTQLALSDDPDSGTRSPSSETFLNERGVKWTFLPQVPLTLFDRQRSLDNQARLTEPLNQDRVARYVIKRQGGSPYPAVITHKDRKSGMHLMIDGNHRLHAAIATEEPGLSVLLVDPDTPRDVIITLEQEANDWHGQPTSDEDRLRHAMYLHDQGATLTDAARIKGIPASRLTNYAGKINAGRRATSCGILPQSWDKLDDASKTRLGQITPTEVFEAATRLAIDAGMKFNPDVKEMANSLSKTDSYAEKIELLKQLKEAYRTQIQQRGRLYKSGTGKGRQLSPRVKLTQTLGLVVSGLPSAADLKEHYRTADEISALDERLSKAIEALQSLRRGIRG